MRYTFDIWVRKIPWRRAWQATPVFLPGEAHGQTEPGRLCPWGCEELDTTEATWHVLGREAPVQPWESLLYCGGGAGR